MVKLDVSFMALISQQYYKNETHFTVNAQTWNNISAESNLKTNTVALVVSKVIS